jgi:predicted RNA-binding protein with PIN domain
MQYYIDGYNLLFKLESFRKHSFEAKRLQLIEELSQILSSLNITATLVFDGSMPRPERAVRSHFHDLEIVYTPEEQTADAYIISEIERARHPGEVIVVTSDKSLASHCRTLGGHSKDIHSFISFLKKKQIQQKSAQTPSTRAFDQTDAHIAHYLKIFEDRLKND